MHNINKRTAKLQEKVVDKFNKSKLPHFSLCGQMPHGAFIDFMWYTQGLKVMNSPLEKEEGAAKAAKELGEKLGQFDVILFLDIDCVPVSDGAIDCYVQQASEGKLIGNAQRSGHIQNNNHMFAAPSAVAISKDSFLKIGTPSAMETTRGDVEVDGCSELLERVSAVATHTCKRPQRTSIVVKDDLENTTRAVCGQAEQGRRCVRQCAHRAKVKHKCLNHQAATPDSLLFQGTLRLLQPNLIATHQTHM
jgi:hypothetical protein